MNSKRVRFYDATLTEGLAHNELTTAQRQELARQLDASHVDFIEVGTALAQNGHVERFHAAEGFQPQYALAAFHIQLRDAKASSARAVLKAAQQAQTPVVMLSARLQAMPEATRQSLLQIAREMHRQGRLVMFKALDFFQVYPVEAQAVWDLFSLLWEAGVQVFTLGDERGRSLPWEVATGTYEVRRRFPQAELGFWMANVNACADDNALSAVGQGATVVHGTLHGYGQGQGYTDLACVGAALWRQRQATFTSQDLEHLWEWSERLHTWLYAPLSS